MDAEAMSGALAVVAGIARGSFGPKFVVAVCKVTVLRGTNRIHASVPAYAESHFQFQIEARLRAMRAAGAIRHSPVCMSNSIQIPFRHGS